jgi:hypothetical protein
MNHSKTKEYFQNGYSQLINIYSKLQIGNDPIANPINVKVSTDIITIGNQEEYIFGMLGGMMLTEEEKTILNELQKHAQEIKLNVDELKVFIQENNYLLLCSEKFKKDFFKNGFVSDFCGRDIIWTALLTEEILLIKPKEFFVKKSDIEFSFDPGLTAKRSLEVTFLKEPIIKKIKVVR